MEIVVTAIFVFIVLGTTSSKACRRVSDRSPRDFGLALVHLISIPVSNTSVNPARSLATAVFQGDWALGQVWAFIVFPAIGAVVAGGLWMGSVSPRCAGRGASDPSSKHPVVGGRAHIWVGFPGP